ncbi:hypothetical protein [Ralstonia pseudosolanacearum]|uniref:hypothetical protein n=1 Tax=Ralstonia pseudosolanacearum TaxID=1310165 RepID=UPI001FF9F462|nr:hypothetical protein [Ralstonia pseudosolanacearum]
MAHNITLKTKLVAGLATILFSQACNAVGIVSRSCLPAGAQESITVDWGFQPHQLWTASEHHRNGAFLHVVNTVSSSPDTGGWQNTWRSYAGHLGSEFWYGTVIGYHWGNSGGAFFMYGTTTSTDCNLSQWGAS